MLNSKTFSATASISFIGISKFKSFVESVAHIVNSHSVKIGSVSGIHVYSNTVDVVMFHADFTTLLGIHVF